MDFSKIAEQKIAEAIEEGLFDDLPGKGEPLNLDEDAHVPAHVRLANRILKNANVLPEWIELQKEIHNEREEVSRLWDRLAREYRLRRAQIEGVPASHAVVAGFCEWLAYSRARYLRSLKGVNTSILKFSIASPTRQVVYRSYKIDEEMARFDADFPLPDNATAPASEPKPAGDESFLRQAARLRSNSGGGPVLSWMKTARLSLSGRMSDESPEE